MSLSFRQIGLRGRMTARLAVEPSIYGNISGNGSDLGYPRGKLEKLTVYRRWYQEPGTLAFGKNVKEMLGSAELGIIPENGAGVITKEDIVAELNSRNYFSGHPIVTREQAIMGAVAYRLFRQKWPLAVSSRWSISKGTFNDKLVANALTIAKQQAGKPATSGVDFWKDIGTYDQRARRHPYYNNATYPYKDETVLRTPGRKVI